MGIHAQNVVQYQSLSGEVCFMDLNREYLRLMWDEVLRECPEATVVDARAMICGL